jgi:uncharacterized protein YabN with tetrapyrrole methylase and pyrophosphatase domain
VVILVENIQTNVATVSRMRLVLSGPAWFRSAIPVQLVATTRSTKQPEVSMNLAKAYTLIAKGAALKITTSDRSLMARKLYEECRELCLALEEGKPEQIRDEMGDVLIILARISYHLCIGMGESLRVASEKLWKRFDSIEMDLKSRAVNINHLSHDEALSLYRSAKKRVG